MWQECSLVRQLSHQKKRYSIGLTLHWNTIIYNVCIFTWLVLGFSRAREQLWGLSPSHLPGEQPLTSDGETVAGGCWCGIQGVSDVCRAKCEHSVCTLARGKGPHSPPPWGLMQHPHRAINSSAQQSQHYVLLVISYLETGSIFLHRLSIFPLRGKTRSPLLWEALRETSEDERLSQKLNNSLRAEPWHPHTA